MLIHIIFSKYIVNIVRDFINVRNKKQSIKNECLSNNQQRTRFNFYPIFKYTILLILIACNNKTDFKPGTLTIFTKTNKSYNFTLEIAETKAQLKQGLMFREKILDNQAMIFLFPKEQKISMWMKNTNIPLDILFVKQNGIIIDIVENTTPHSQKLIIAKENVSIAIELKAGTVQNLEIQKGDKITWQRL